MLNANDFKLIKFVQEMFAGIGSTPKVNWGIGYINFCASTCSDVFSECCDEQDSSISLSLKLDNSLSRKGQHNELRISDLAVSASCEIYDTTYFPYWENPDLQDLVPEPVIQVITEKAECFKGTDTEAFMLDDVLSINFGRVAACALAQLFEQQSEKNCWTTFCSCGLYSEDVAETYLRHLSRFKARGTNSAA